MPQGHVRCSAWPTVARQDAGYELCEILNLGIERERERIGIRLLVDTWTDAR